MIRPKEQITYSPGGENTNTGGTFSKDNEPKDNSKHDTEKKEEEKPTLLKKIKNALKDWAEDDQRDLNYDDTRV